MSNLFINLDEKRAIVGIVSLGYVGLSLIDRFREVGHKVIGFDIDQRKIDSPRSGASYIRHISSQAIRGALAKAAYLGFPQGPQAPFRPLQRRSDSGDARRLRLRAPRHGPHDKFDYTMVKANAKLMIDSRSRYLEAAKNIAKA